MNQPTNNYGFGYVRDNIGFGIVAENENKSAYNMQLVDKLNPGPGSYEPKIEE